MRLYTIPREVAEEHYGEHRQKPFFSELVDFITGGPVVIAKITGDDAITCWRTLMGPTNPVDAAPGSIRGDFATLLARTAWSPHCKYAFFVPGTIERCHAVGLDSNVWTVDNPETVRRLADLGADAVITNRPDAARAAL